MNDPVRVEVVKSMYQLLSNFTNFRLWQFSIVLQDFKELSLGELCDHAELMGSFKGVKKQNDVLVVETFQNVDFLTKII